MSNEKIAPSESMPVVNAMRIGGFIAKLMLLKSRYLVPVAFVLLSLGTVSGAGASDPPNEPLNLTDALALVDNPHPFTRGAELDFDTAQTNAEFHASSNQLSLEAIIVPQHVDRAAPGADSSLNDGHATLRLTHPLYDFGRKKAAKAEAQLGVDIAQHRLNYIRAQKQVEIMRRFFDVLIADLDYGVKNEKMTLAFLRYNRYQEELDMYDAHAEVDVLNLETNYREQFVIRQEANYDRLNARRNLGLELGFTDYIPRDLESPDLSAYVERAVPEFNELLEDILMNNYAMKLAQLYLDKAILAADVSDSKYQPQLDAVLEAKHWEQKTGSRNAASVGLHFKLPLAAGDMRKRDRRMSELAIERARAELVEVEHSIRKRAFELWKALTLNHVNLNAAEVRLNFRDQYMDRARTLYELEERSDLGDAQAEQLRALLEKDKVHFNLTLTWSEIDALMGKPIHSL